MPSRTQFPHTGAVLISGMPGLSGAHPRGPFMRTWKKPAYTDLRLGFEVTMYVSNR